MKTHRLQLAAACAAIALASPALSLAQPATHAPAASASAPVATPRLADGKPDLNGYWNGRRPGAGGASPFGAKLGEDGSVDFALPGREGSLGNFEKDSAVLERSETNKPIYKPEYWDKVQDLDWNGLTIDPSFHCKWDGVPRMGPPQKIMQVGNEVAFIYESQNLYRLMYTDGREHDPVRSQDQTWMGDSVARWEGDTLVVDTVGFNNISWLGWTGYLHSTELHVTEKFRREGNALHYEVVVEDPTVLQEPWHLEPRTMWLNADPKAQLWQDLPCEERDAPNITQPNMRG